MGECVFAVMSMIVYVDVTQMYQRLYGAYRGGEGKRDSVRKDLGFKGCWYMLVALAVMLTVQYPFMTSYFISCHSSTPLGGDLALG